MKLINSNLCDPAPNDPVFLEILEWVRVCGDFPGGLSPLAIFVDWPFITDANQANVIDSHCRSRGCVAQIVGMRSSELFLFTSLIDMNKGIKYEREWFYGEPGNMVIPDDGKEFHFPDWQWHASPLIQTVRNESTRKKRELRVLVYFILAKKSRLVKIGKSLDPRSRLAQLRTGSPDSLTILKCIRGGAEMESELHRRFASARSHGEWFRLTPELNEFIESMEDCS